jgi:hypothetical protein
MTFEHVAKQSVCGEELLHTHTVRMQTRWSNYVDIYHPNECYRSRRQVTAAPRAVNLREDGRHTGARAG